MFKAILFDLDGTIYKGKQLIPGVKDVLSELEKRSVKIFFVTNASNRSRKGTLEKLRSLGIKASEEQVYNTSYATGTYLSEHFPGKKVFCISEGGLQEEMNNSGLGVVDSEHVDVVVVGLDRKFNYEKLVTAYKAIHSGATFIASNDDPCFPMEKGFLPGAGSMVESIAKATGKRPKILGKPESYMIDLIIDQNNLNKKDLLIVGDRLETDILAGKKADIKTALVLTGVAKKQDLEKLKERPDYVLESLSELITLP